MEPKKRRTRTNRVERQIQLAGRARELENTASQLVADIDLPQGLIDTDRERDLPAPTTWGCWKKD